MPDSRHGHHKVNDHRGNRGIAQDTSRVGAAGTGLTDAGAEGGREGREVTLATSPRLRAGLLFVWGLILDYKY
jgi:hypothetical protein